MFIFGHQKGRSFAEHDCSGTNILLQCIGVVIGRTFCPGIKLVVVIWYGDVHVRRIPQYDIFMFMAIKRNRRKNFSLAALVLIVVLNNKCLD